MALARGIDLALRGAPGFAARSFGAGGHLQLGLGVLQRLTLGLRVDAGLLQLVLDIDEAGALGKTPRRAGRGVGGGDKAVPAPDVAFERDQPLAGLELRDQFGAALLGTTPICARRRASSAGACTWSASGTTPSGSAGSPSVTPALVQRIGADGSTGASRSSPSAAPIAFS